MIGITQITAFYFQPAVSTENTVLVNSTLVHHNTLVLFFWLRWSAIDSTFALTAKSRIQGGRAHPHTPPSSPPPTNVTKFCHKGA
jgi:hypothetical protein